MKKVLILDGGATHACAIAECLKKSGYFVGVLCQNKYEYGYHTQFADEHHLGPDSHDPLYARYLLIFLSTNHYDVLIPTSDASAECISIHKADLQRFSGILMPDYGVFQKAYDKNFLMKVCQENGYPHPFTIDLSKENTEEILAQFPYPGLIKPNLTSGGRGMTLVHSYAEFQQRYPSIHKQYGACHLQQFIPEGGKQIKVQIMTERDGTPRYSSVIWKQRYYPIHGGSSCCNVTIEDSAIVRTCGEVLQSIGWCGFADFDLIEHPDTHEFLIMEINPRIPACIRSAFKSGMDYATMIADATLGYPIKQYSYQPGMRLRHLGFEVMWFIKSHNRMHAHPSWFHFFEKNLYYQDWIKGDFPAFFWGTIGNIRKQMNPEFRKAKAGVSIK